MNKYQRAKSRSIKRFAQHVYDSNGVRISYKRAKYLINTFNRKLDIHFKKEWKRIMRLRKRLLKEEP